MTELSQVPILLGRLLVSALLATVGLGIGIVLPQLFPRQAAGETVKIAYPVFHLVAIAISVGVPWINAQRRGWCIRDRIMAPIIAGIAVFVLWHGFGWGMLLAESWERAW